MVRYCYIINTRHCFKLSCCLLQSTTIWLRLLPTSGGRNSKLSDLPHFCPPILVQVSFTGHMRPWQVKTFTITFSYVLVIYKTSLLHLQPRQMTIYLPEVRKISHDFMSLPVFNPNVFSEDEDDLPGSNNWSSLEICFIADIKLVARDHSDLHSFPCVLWSDGVLWSGWRQSSLHSQHSNRSHTQPCSSHVSHPEHRPGTISPGQSEYSAWCLDQPHSQRCCSSCCCCSGCFCPC